MSKKITGKTLKESFLKAIKAVSFFLFVSCPLYAANNGMLGQFKGEFETQITSVTSDIASMVNTFLTGVGILWIVILFVMAGIQKERLMEHIKGIIAVSVILSIAWGVSYSLI